MKTRNFLLFFLLIFFSSYCVSDDLLDYYVKDKARQGSYLYIESPEDIKNMHGVIYILSQGELSSSFQGFFKKYSNSLKEDFGGVILDPKNSSYFSYIKLSSCNIVEFSSSVLVYENRYFNECFYFKTDKEEEFYTALKAVDLSIENNKPLITSYSKYKLCRLLTDMKISIISEMKEEFCELFEYLLGKNESNKCVKNGTC